MSAADHDEPHQLRDRGVDARKDLQRRANHHDDQRQHRRLRRQGGQGGEHHHQHGGLHQVLAVEERHLGRPHDRASDNPLREARD